MWKSKIKSNIYIIGMVVGLVLIGTLFVLPLHESWFQRGRFTQDLINGYFFHPFIVVPFLDLLFYTPWVDFYFKPLNSYSLTNLKPR